MIVEIPVIEAYILSVSKSEYPVDLNDIVKC